MRRVSRSVGDGIRRRRWQALWTINDFIVIRIVVVVDACFVVWLLLLYSEPPQKELLERLDMPVFATTGGEPERIELWSPITGSENVSCGKF